MSEPGSLIRALSGRPSARNYHSYVINEIGVAIASGAMTVGSILPNDAEMIDRFGVSRTVLREALKTLEAKGLVEARAKVGTRVMPQARWNLFDRQVLGWILEAGPDPAFVDAFRTVRHTIEVEAAALAARHRTAEHMRLMHYWLNQRAATAVMPEPFAMAEFELHRTVAEASLNPFLRAASGLVEFGVVIETRPRLIGGTDAPADGLAAEKAGLYAGLVDAIESGSGDRAADTMDRILTVAPAG